MSLTSDLREWRRDRRITEGSTNIYVANIIEELLEIYHTDKKLISEVQEEIIGIYFSHKYPISELNTIDAIQDIQVFSINETELMGYNNSDCNNEVYHEINSRKQCPHQEKEWSLGINLEQKWQKDKEQPPDTMYKADYSRCRF